MSPSNAAFEQALRAIKLAAYTSPLSIDPLTIELPVNSVDAVGVLQSKLSNNASSIETVSSFQSDDHL